MTATPSIELPAWMAEQLSQASPDLLRQMVQIFAEALMSADVDGCADAARQRAASTLASDEAHLLCRPSALRCKSSSGKRSPGTCLGASLSL